jgi:hypothetical protein
LIQKFFLFFFCYNFFSIFWSLKPWIRISIQPKMLDPDPDEMNADPQPCLERGVDAAAVVVVEQQVDGVEWVVRLLADLRDVLVQEF